MLQLDSTRLACCHKFADIDEFMGKCNFSDLWLEDSRFKGWIRPVVGDSREAYCHVCKKKQKKNSEYHLDVSVQGMGRVLVNIMTGHRCQRFLYL